MQHSTISRTNKVISPWLSKWCHLEIKWYHFNSKWYHLIGTNNEQWPLIAFSFITLFPVMHKQKGSAVAHRCLWRTSLKMITCSKAPSAIPGTFPAAVAHEQPNRAGRCRGEYSRFTSQSTIFQSYLWRHIHHCVPRAQCARFSRVFTCPPIV